MRKIFKLYRNEITKYSRKVLLMIAIIIMVLSIIATNGLMYFVEKLEGSYSSYISDDFDYRYNNNGYYWSDEEITEERLTEDKEEYIKSVEKLSAYIVENADFDEQNNANQENNSNFEASDETVSEKTAEGMAFRTYAIEVADVSADEFITQYDSEAETGENDGTEEGSETEEDEAVTVDETVPENSDDGLLDGDYAEPVDDGEYYYSEERKYTDKYSLYVYSVIDEYYSSGDTATADSIMSRASSCREALDQYSYDLVAFTKDELCDKYEIENLVSGSYMDKMLYFEVYSECYAELQALNNEMIEKYTGYGAADEVCYIYYCIASDFETVAENSDFASADNSKIGEMLKNKDYNEYIEYRISVINASELTDQQKKIQIECLELQRNIDTDKMTTAEWKEIDSYTKSYGEYKLCLATNTTTSGDVMSPSERTEYLQCFNEIQKSIEKQAVGYGGTMSSEGLSNLTMGIEIATKVAMATIIILGALLIAEEMQTGAVKSLLIAPVKRSKIFSAKLLLLLTGVVFMMVLTYITTVLCDFIFGYGISNIVVTIGGSAVSMNLFVYLLCYTALAFVEVLMYGLMALMFSALFRKVAGAIGVSLGISLMVSGIASTGIALLVSNSSETTVFDLIRMFIPTENFDLQSRVLASALSQELDIAAILTGNYLTSDINITFSAIYLTVIAVLMVWTARDSFCKRDIK